MALASLPHLPHPPLLGNLLEFRRDPIALLRRAARRCGDIGVFHLGPRPIVLVQAPELAREILVDQADSFEKGPVIRKLARPLFGEGLVACRTERHRAHRQDLAPLFAPGRLGQVPAIVEAELARARARLFAGAVIDLTEEIDRLVLAIVGRILFGVDLLGEARELAAALAQVNRLVVARIRNPLLPSLDGAFSSRRARRSLALLEEAVGRLIAQRRTGAATGDDVLTRLLAAPGPQGGALSDRRVRDEMVTLLAAGHETTASALTWILIRLARHPAHAARVRAELAGGQPIEAGGHSATGRFVAETLRLHPPVHTLGRQVRRAVRVGKHLLPAGTIVAVSVYLLHRRADLYPEPERFDPERFTPERQAALPRCAYLPFGAGARACLGGALARLEIDACLQGLLGRLPLRLASDAEIEPEMLVTLRPRRPVQAQVLADDHG